MASAKSAKAKRKTSRKCPCGCTCGKHKRKQPSRGEFYDRGARVISVYGPFASRALVEMPVSVAADIFDKHLLSTVGRTQVVESVDRDLADLAKRAPGLDGSALAATATALAYELDHPFNSATSKSMCSKSLAEVFDRLRAIAPPEEKTDDLDELKLKRDQRLAARKG